MSEQQLLRWRVYFAALVVLGELAHLTWEHFNGGVVSHHILNRADLPAISNWFGALLLPALAWFLTGRIQRRIASYSGWRKAASKFPTSVVVGFFGSLVFGMLLSVSFTNGYENISSYLFVSMLLSALLLPVYRPECVLGFILGMTFTFGAVLPTAIGSIVAAISAVIHLVVRPVLVHAWTRLKRVPSPNA
ncbi:MAG: hypothetical protein ACREPE_05205 [Lysobacter sp.]